MINGNQLRDAYISAANHIMARRQEVDALNVFPVPDGDTGTNMSMTINAGGAGTEIDGEPHCGCGGQDSGFRLVAGRPRQFRGDFIFAVPRFFQRSGR